MLDSGGPERGRVLLRLAELVRRDAARLAEIDSQGFAGYAAVVEPHA